MRCSSGTPVLRYSGDSMSAAFLAETNAFIWSYVFGPFLAFLPARWRAMWFGNREINWRGATILSGIMQFAAGPFVLLLAIAFVSNSLNQALGELLRTGPGAFASPGAFQMFSLTIAAVHPVTWIGFYMFFEGAGRAIAAGITGETNGTLPLVLLDWAYLFGQRKIWKTEPPLVPDQVTNNISRAGWFLKIESCRLQRGWDVGRLLLYKDQYYRIDSFSHESGPRPYVFLLRSVSAGVRSRSVILYSPERAVPEPIVSPQGR
jgi:hypothetical protein